MPPFNWLGNNLHSMHGRCKVICKSSSLKNTDTVSQILNTKLMTCNGRLHSYLHSLKLTGTRNVDRTEQERERMPLKVDPFNIWFKLLMLARPKVVFNSQRSHIHCSSLFLFLFCSYLLDGGKQRLLRWRWHWRWRSIPEEKKTEKKKEENFLASNCAFSASFVKKKIHSCNEIHLFRIFIWVFQIISS